ncbi:MAG TPA: DUF6152 family protein [Terriglobia bacterium]|nr:DUF6152 family protein [Terriglobia bacterium]
MNIRHGLVRVLILVGMALPLSGHHSFSAEYDQDTIVSVPGKLTWFDWSNPHIYATVDVAGRDGSTVTWYGEVTGAGPAWMIERGVTREMASKLIGQTVTMRGAWARNRSAKMGNANLKTDKGFLLTDQRADTAPRSAHNAGLALKPVEAQSDATLVVSVATVSTERRSEKDALAFFEATPSDGVLRIDEEPGCPVLHQFAPMWGSYGACVPLADGAAPPSRFLLAPGAYEIRHSMGICPGICALPQLSPEVQVQAECRTQIRVKRGDTLYLRFTRTADACTATVSPAPASQGERDMQKNIDAGQYQSLEFPKRRLP